MSASAQLEGHKQSWLRSLRQAGQRIEQPLPMLVEGRLTRMVGLTLEARGFEAPVGARCLIHTSEGELEAEVVGFSGDLVYLMPTGEIRGLVPNARVIPSRSVYQVRAGDALLGRVIDAAGNPLDDLGSVVCEYAVPLTGRRFNPLNRKPVHEPLDVGVAAINALLSVGRGQRLGLFAGSGVGKSVLLGMMTRFTEADVIVVGLIGERGREVKEFVNDILGEHGMRRAVVVAAPADSPPLLRLHGAWLATAIAEHFRDQGRNVLLLMDSLTRFAQAQREVALAIGEPPATKGYPPSVFAKLPQLVERAGNGIDGGGSITAFYTVLAEGDDQNDPVVDAARAILDGHIVLSRELAESGHYPAIDIEASISRVMDRISSPDHVLAARRFKQIYSAYRKNQDLINIGAYQKGSDPRVDEAIRYFPAFSAFLQQGMDDAVDYEQSLEDLLELTGNAKALARKS